MPDNRFFISDNGTNQETLTKEQIPELEDDWVTIKKKLTTNDFSKMQANLIQYEAVATTRAEAQRMKITGQSPVKLNYNPDTAFLLELAIIDWSFKDGITGEKIPITITTLGQMDPSLANKLQAEIDDRNPI